MFEKVSTVSLDGTIRVSRLPRTGHWVIWVGADRFKSDSENEVADYLETSTDCGPVAIGIILNNIQMRIINSVTFNQKESNNG